MKLGVWVKCGYKCRAREGFCAKCKDAVPLPSIAAAAMTRKSLQTLVAKKISSATLI